MNNEVVKVEDFGGVKGLAKAFQIKKGGDMKRDVDIVQLAVCVTGVIAIAALLIINSKPKENLTDYTIDCKGNCAQKILDGL